MPWSLAASRSLRECWREWTRAPGVLDLMSGESATECAESPPPATSRAAYRKESIKQQHVWTSAPQRATPGTSRFSGPTRPTPHSGADTCSGDGTGTGTRGRPGTRVGRTAPPNVTQILLAVPPLTVSSLGRLPDDRQSPLQLALLRCRPRRRHPAWPTGRASGQRIGAASPRAEQMPGVASAAVQVAAVAGAPRSLP